MRGIKANEIFGLRKDPCRFRMKPGQHWSSGHSSHCCHCHTNGRLQLQGPHCELTTSSLRGTTGRPHWVLLLQVSPYSRQGAGRPP